MTARALETISVDDIGDRDAPEGTEPWAIALRLSMQTIVGGISRWPEKMADYVSKALKHRAWTFWKDEHGSPFASFDAFCAYPPPHGLGTSWAKIHPFVRASRAAELGSEAAADRELAAATVSLAAAAAKPTKKAGGKRPGAGRKADVIVTDDGHIAPNPAKASSRESSLPGQPDSKGGNKADYLAGRIKAKAEAGDERAADVLRRAEAGEYSSMRAAARDAGVVKPKDAVKAAARAIAAVPIPRFAELARALPENLRRTLAACLKDASS